MRGRSSGIGGRRTIVVLCVIESDRVEGHSDMRVRTEVVVGVTVVDSV